MNEDSVPWRKLTEFFQEKGKNLSEIKLPLVKWQAIWSIPKLAFDEADLAILEEEVKTRALVRDPPAAVIPPAVVPPAKVLAEPKPRGRDFERLLAELAKKADFTFSEFAYDPNDSIYDHRHPRDPEDLDKPTRHEAVCAVIKPRILAWQTEHPTKTFGQIDRHELADLVEAVAVEFEIPATHALRLVDFQWDQWRSKARIEREKMQAHLMADLKKTNSALSAALKRKDGPSPDRAPNAKKHKAEAKEAAAPVEVEEQAEDLEAILEDTSRTLTLLAADETKLAKCKHQGAAGRKSGMLGLDKPSEWSRVTNVKAQGQQHLSVEFTPKASMPHPPITEVFACTLDGTVLPTLKDLVEATKKEQQALVWWGIIAELKMFCN